MFSWRCVRWRGSCILLANASIPMSAQGSTRLCKRWNHETHTAENISVDKIRNFSIVAHVDHGKSTLADRLLELTGTMQQGSGVPQVLDQLAVERRRGITIKAHTATMFHNMGGELFMLNLIDTPGHVDFSYEVSRSLSACQGALLVVDGQQGVQAQTVANFLLASEAGLSLVPVINKIDLPAVDLDKVMDQMHNAFGFERSLINKVSAKFGTGVLSLLDAIVTQVPSPVGTCHLDHPLRILLFDSWFDQYRGVICHIAVIDGTLKRGDVVCSLRSGLSYEVSDLGILQMKEIPLMKLYSGQVGYAVLGMRTAKEAFIGDTFHHPQSTVTPLPGFRPVKPMVFAGMYPMDQSEYPVLRTAIEKLTLNDSSVSIYPDSSAVLGQGWRLGFLGLLHMDVFQQRLEEEFDMSVILTSPSVPYKVIKRDGSEETLLNPAQFPEVNKVNQFLEPVVLGTLVLPDEYLGSILQLCEERRGIQQELIYIDQNRVVLKYVLPLNEVIVDFHDQIKSLSSGYASFDYEDHGYQPTSVLKLEILLNGIAVDALACIVHEKKAYTFGKVICQKIKDSLHRQLYEVAIQAAVGKRVIARETVKALRKNVTAKCYGGDITRKMKLLKKQKEGKKKMKKIGNVELSKDVFLAILQK
ncbi:hypothetical protein EMCRGX_G029052 [Ephydatia muelleri]